MITREQWTKYWKEDGDDRNTNGHLCFCCKKRDKNSYYIGRFVSAHGAATFFYCTSCFEDVIAGEEFSIWKD